MIRPSVTPPSTPPLRNMAATSDAVLRETPVLWISVGSQFASR